MSTFNPNSAPKKNRLWISPQHRLIIYNDAAYKEELALRLNWRNVGIFAVLSGLFLLGFAFLILRIFGTNSQSQAIVITGDDNMREQLLFINGQLDSLLKEIDARDVYIAQINKKINGEFEYQADADKKLAESGEKEKDKKVSKNEKMPDLAPETKQIAQSAQSEAELSADKSREKGFSGINLPQNSSYFNFSPPLKGILSDSFAPAHQHYGLNINAATGAEIRATQEGIIVLTGWSAEDGHFIIIQHPNNLISIYKNNSVLLKKQTDRVEKGEIIAVIGNGKGKNTAAQLYFELWHYGLPLNPQKFMAFR